MDTLVSFPKVSGYKINVHKSFKAKPPTPPKTNMNTQNDGLEQVTPFKYGQCLVSMLDFWCDGVYHHNFHGGPMSFCFFGPIFFMGVQCLTLQGTRKHIPYQPFAGTNSFRRGYPSPQSWFSGKWDVSKMMYPNIMGI